VRPAKQLLAAAAIALAIFALHPTGARAEEQTGIPYKECRVPECVMIPGAAFAGLVTGHNQQVQKIEDLERQLRELKVSKGCGKVEVTEPSKTTKPLVLKPGPPT
jgi:hypothetical protein